MGLPLVMKALLGLVIGGVALVFAGRKKPFEGVQGFDYELTFKAPTQIQDTLRTWLAQLEREKPPTVETVAGASAYAAELSRRGYPELAAGLNARIQFVTRSS